MMNGHADEAHGYQAVDDEQPPKSYNEMKQVYPCFLTRVTFAFISIILVRLLTSNSQE